MGYDSTGNRTSVQDSKSGYSTMTFDALNRQSTEKVSGSGISAMRFDYAYDAAGCTTSLTRYSDLAGSSVVGTTAYIHDADSRVTNITSTNSAGTALANYTYVYDAADRLTSKVENGSTVTYGYDAANQLTYDGAASAFSYDGTGNRTISGYSTGTGNRLTTDGVWTYTYDAEGNLTQKSKGLLGEKWDYTYDHINQMLTAAYSPTGFSVTQRVTYSYDAWGSRIQRQAWTGGATTTERYGLDAWDTAKPPAIGNENIDAWVEMDGSNTLTLRRASGVGFDENVSRQTSGGTVLWYLPDYQRSVRAVIDNSGSVVNSTTFTAAGVVTSGSIYDGPGYTGQRHDNITLYVWAGDARDYNTNTMRFLSEDPKGFAAGDANLYRYVGNGPTNAIDPSGMDLVAVGEDAAQEALWQLQHTYQISRDDIQVVDLGTGGDGVWENPGGTGRMYLIVPKSNVERPFPQRDGQPAAGVDRVDRTVTVGKGYLTRRVGLGQKLGPDSQVPAIQSLYSAFWDTGTPYFVARLARDAKIPGTDTPLQGQWHTTVADGKQLYVGGPSGPGLLTREQWGRMSNALFGSWKYDAFIAGDPGLNHDGLRISGFVDEKALIRAEKAARAETERRLNPPRGSLEYEQRFFREHFGVPGEFVFGLFMGGAHGVGHMLFLPMPMPEFTREFASSAYGVGFALGYGGSIVGTLAAGTPSQFRFARSMRDLMAVEARETSRSLAAQMMGSAEAALSRQLYTGMTISPGGVVAPAAGRVPRTGGSPNIEAYRKSIGPYEFVEVAGQQYTQKTCVPAVLEQRLGSAKAADLRAMFAEAERRGGYELEKAANYLRETKLAKDSVWQERITIEKLREQTAAGDFTLLNVRGSLGGTGAHAVGIEGFDAATGRFLIHDPLLGTRYWQSAEVVQGRMIGDAILVK